MARIRVVTDSTADIDGNVAERLGIATVPLNVHWNGDTYLDKIEITTDEFYRKLREEKGTPKTSQPSAGQFGQVFTELLKDADGVIALLISGKLSGTLNSAQVAAEAVDRQRITVIDTKMLSTALGAVVTRVAELANRGATLAECTELANDVLPRLKLYFALDTLEYLRRGGRIGRAQAFAGNLLSIKLLLQIFDGEVYPVDRVRTRAGVIKRTAEVVADLGPIEEAAVLYGDDPKPAEQLKALVQKAYPGQALAMGRIGPVLGTHTGPGVIGFSALLAKK